MTTTQERPASGGRPAGGPFLEVEDLKVHFSTDDGLVKSVDGLSYSLERGKTWASWGSPARASR